MDIDTSDKREQRKFGIVMAVGVTVVGLIRWVLHRDGLPWAFFAVAALFLVLGLVAPRVLRPFFIAWMKFTAVKNWVVTRVLLTLAFWLMIVPTRCLVSIFRTDLLNRAWDPKASTYWEDPEEQPEEFDRYWNQF